MRKQTIDKIRRNHALEHATVARLLERGISPPLGGYSVPSGFLIWGRVSPDDVAKAAAEALLLLRSGHRELAISSYCGTNIVASMVIAGIASTVVTGKKRGLWANVRGAAAALIAAGVLGRPIGRLLQRRFTTLAEVSQSEITGVRMLVGSGPVRLAWVSATHG